MCPLRTCSDVLFPAPPLRSCGLELPTERIGSYETQLVEHFFQSLANTSGMTLHIRQVGARAT